MTLRPNFLSTLVVLAICLSACFQAPDTLGEPEPAKCGGDYSCAPSADSLKLMPLGDSITFGVGSSSGNGYRATLDLLLRTGDPATTAVFVGSQRSGEPRLVHEGYSGWRTEEIDAIIQAKALEFRPNLITLHIGTNDMDQNFDVDNAPERLESLLDTIFATLPDITVVLATLVPANNVDIQARIDAYNPEVRRIVAERKAQSQHIALADMSDVDALDLADVLHPNDAGYDKMAVAFDATIREVIELGWIVERSDDAPPIRTPGQGLRQN